MRFIVTRNEWASVEYDILCIIEFDWMNFSVDNSLLQFR